MKTIIKSVVVILLISLGAGSYAQTPGSKDKLKSIVVYEEKFNSLITKKLKESEVYFDQRGNILEEIEYKEGRITKHFKYQYDNDNNKIREEEYDSAGKLIEYSEYKIENGLRVEKSVYDPNKKLKEKKTYVYTAY
jgi:hypothetical protein